MNNKITVFSVFPSSFTLFYTNFFALKKCEKNNFYIVGNLQALKAEAFTFISCIIYFEDYLILQSMRGQIVTIEMKHKGKLRNSLLHFWLIRNKIMKQEFPDLLNLFLISRKQLKFEEATLKYNPEIQTNTIYVYAVLLSFSIAFNFMTHQSTI